MKRGVLPSAETHAAVDDYCGKLEADGAMLGGVGLRASARGTRVRRSAAQRFVLDGPFTESKELVGGYIVLQMASLDDAVDAVRPWLQIQRHYRLVSCAAIEVRRLL